MKPLAIITEDLDSSALEWLAQRCRVVSRVADGPEAVTAAMPDAQALVVRTYTIVNADFLKMTPRLKVVGRAGVGLDNIDVAECRRRGVEVVHTPDANGDAVAEYVFAILLGELRPLVYLPKALELADWNTLRKSSTAPKQLRELTLGILGLGKVGSRVARIARGFEMPVIYHDLVEIPDARRHGATPVARDELFRRSDILSIHIDHRPGNRHLLNADALKQMKRGVILLNTSRGMAVDHVALADFLRVGHRTAILDVHDPEPVVDTNPLLGMPNAKLAPHLAAATRLAHTNMSWVVRDVWRVLNGEKPEFPANEQWA